MADLVDRTTSDQHRFIAHRKWAPEFTDVNQLLEDAGGWASTHSRTLTRTNEDEGELEVEGHDELLATGEMDEVPFL
jgi:hypothetical protein